MKETDDPFYVGRQRRRESLDRGRGIDLCQPLGRALTLERAQAREPDQFGLFALRLGRLPPRLRRPLHLRQRASRAPRGRLFAVLSLPRLLLRNAGQNGFCAVAHGQNLRQGSGANGHAGEPLVRQRLEQCRHGLVTERDERRRRIHRAILRALPEFIRRTRAVAQVENPPPSLLGRSEGLERPCRERQVLTFHDHCPQLVRHRPNDRSLGRTTEIPQQPLRAGQQFQPHHRTVLPGFEQLRHGQARQGFLQALLKGALRIAGRAGFVPPRDLRQDRFRQIRSTESDAELAEEKGGQWFGQTRVELGRPEHRARQVAGQLGGCVRQIQLAGIHVHGLTFGDAPNESGPAAVAAGLRIARMSPVAQEGDVIVVLCQDQAAHGRCRGPAADERNLAVAGTRQLGPAQRFQPFRGSLEVGTRRRGRRSRVALDREEAGEERGDAEMHDGGIKIPNGRRSKP